VAAEVDRSGRDLLVAVRRGRGAGSLQGQLEEQLRDDVAAGRLRPGEALPSTRALARDLGVSRGVVVEAYAQLAAEGLLVTRPGAATRVARRGDAWGGGGAGGSDGGAAGAGGAGGSDATRAGTGGAGGSDATGAGLGTGGAGGSAARAAGARSVRWDLRVEAGDLGAFPRRAWLAAARDALATAPDAALGYGDRAGAAVLREALAGYLGRARGVSVGPDRLVVTSGATQAIALLAAVLVARGVRRVAVEHPGFPVHRAQLARAGLDVVPVPVDADGIDPSALPGDAGAVLVTPAHQFPLGGTLPPERRRALVAWAGERDALVLEDDYDGEFRFDGLRIGALQGEAPDRVAYIGSASKALVPGLRLGWLALPAGLVAPVVEAKLLADGGSPVLEQLALAELIRTGGLDRHLRRVRARHRRRRDALVAGAAAQLPGARLSGTHAGLHAVADIGPHPDLPAALGRAWERGVAVVGFPHGDRALLLLGWANLPEPAVAPALRELAAAL
jgi:GntR family transcriptional regulator / MocR family aminotransferase